MRYPICAMAMFLSLSLMGCSQNVLVPTPLAANQQTRAMVIGDKLTYDVTSSADMGTYFLKEIKGTDIISVEAASNHDRALPSKIVRTFDIKEVTNLDSGQSNTSIMWCGQDVSGTIYLLGMSKNGLDWGLVTDASYPVDTPSRLANGMAWSYTAHFSNGESLSQNSKIVGIERISTPAGEFDAYKVQVFIKDSEGLVITGYQWIRPELGSIKMDMVVSREKENHELKVHMVTILKSYRLVDKFRFKLFS